MNRQRGFLGLSTFDLIAGIAGIAAFVGGVALLNNMLRHHYVDPIEAKYQPLAAQCKEMNPNTNPADCAARVRTALFDRDNAVAANKVLDEQFTTFRGMHDESVKALARESDRIVGAKKTALEATAGQRAKAALDTFNYIAQMNAGGYTCDQLDAALLELSKERQRDFPRTDFTTPRPPGEAPPVKIVDPKARNPLKATP